MALDISCHVVHYLKCVFGTLFDLINTHAKLKCTSSSFLSLKSNKNF